MPVPPSGTELGREGQNPRASARGASQTATNYHQVAASRAHQSLGYTYAYANGSNQNMGLYNVAVTHTLKETSPGYFVIADGGC